MLRTFFPRSVPTAKCSNTGVLNLVRLPENVERRLKFLTEKTAPVIKIRRHTVNCYEIVDNASESTLHAAVNYVLKCLA